MVQADREGRGGRDGRDGADMAVRAEILISTTKFRFYHSDFDNAHGISSHYHPFYKVMPNIITFVQILSPADTMVILTSQRVCPSKRQFQGRARLVFQQNHAFN